MKPFFIFLIISLSTGQPSSTTLADLDHALAEQNFAQLDKTLQTIQTPETTRAALAILRARVGDSNKNVRRLAAYAFAELEPGEAKRLGPELIEALKHSEPRVRARVALSLGRMGVKDAAGPLHDLVKDADPRVRVGAARALATLAGDAQTTTHLLTGLLKDADPGVRILAASVLAELAPASREAIPALKVAASSDADENVRAAVTIALATFDPPVAALLDMLTAPDASRRLWALSVLSNKAKDIKSDLPRVIAVLQKDEDPSVRAGAAFTLAKVNADAVAPVLIEALKDKSSRVRASAALALGLLGPNAKGAGPALVAALEDDVEVATAATTALGNLGPEAQAAVPLLVKLLQQDNVDLRRRAITILAHVGPAARSAGSALLAALSDADPVVRREAARGLVTVGPQPRAPLTALTDALSLNETPADAFVRSWACLSLGALGPAATDAIPALLQTLQDDAPNVRAAAALALGRIGSPAVAALVKALDHVDHRVRTGAAEALAVVSPPSRRALPELGHALQDENAEVSLAAGKAVARIAIGLQFLQETGALDELTDTLPAFEAAQRRHEWTQQVELAAHTEQVRLAIRTLQSAQRARFIENLLQRPWLPWLIATVVYVVSMLTLWSLLLWLRPLALFRINEALRPLPRIDVPALFGRVELSFRNLLLVSLFDYHRRVLDAWVARQVGSYRETFEARRTVVERSIYVSLPILLDGQLVASPTIQQLGQKFARKRGCLLIWGEGGAGKTTLACQLALAALAENAADRPCSHLMLPVLIEHDLDLRVADNKPPFTAFAEAIRGQLQAILGQQISAEFLGHLLRRRRILVIVDHLSEISLAAREAIRPGDADFPAHALVVTSRTEEILDDVPKTVIQPLRIQGNRLASFLEDFLAKSGKRHLFDDAEFFDECRRLSLLAGASEITLLLTKLYAQQMITRKERPQSTVPTNLPDLLLGYLNELNRAVDTSRRRGDLEVQRDAGAVAWECMRENLRPEPAPIDTVLLALEAPDARARLAYLDEQLKILRLVDPSQDRVSFTLAPLAEYLAASHLITKYRADPDFWRDLTARAAASPSEETRSFMSAVRESCRVRKVAPTILDVLDGGLSRAA